ncbi:fumarylacetoacetase [Flavobacterium algicola]|uniref:fumarylacetoacetase n=1 Tax=Flavobacterium algicola TaxID=556529 RepID=UPI001EFEA34B|nr:fumarylacetoacetase [Flavobacterium algicola]MCG9792826.1 fumarylacetoacetase [Flavobacterium algicola]
MPISANDTKRKSWLSVPENSDFPIQNIPFGVFLTKENIVTVGTRIGDYAIDLGALQQMNYFSGIELTDDMFMQDTLNDFISDGKKTWRLVRNRIADIFDEQNPQLRDNDKHKDIIIFNIDDVEMQLPVLIGDYTDFYSSKEHAINMGKMFRTEENALLPNWSHMPIAYHGRSSTIIPSGIPVHRPLGQSLPHGEETPVIGPSRSIDFELETAFITTDANIMGEMIPISEAEDYIFGMVMLNDWTSRDILKWEYLPLGPFLSKNFATSISPWIVTMDALEPFKVPGPKQVPSPLPYLQQKGKHSFDIHLEAAIQPENGTENVVSKSNFKHLYWTMNQQLTHHASSGCRINSGDMMGSGAISGANKENYGSMLELTWGGKNPIKLNDGTERKFINDYDTVIMKGFCKNSQVRIGFGELCSQLLPPFVRK